MFKEIVTTEVLALMEARDWGALRAALIDAPGAEVADLMLSLEKQDRVLLFRSLPREVAADAFAHLEAQQQDDLLHDMRDGETRRLLADMSPDDRTHLLEELPGRATQRLLNLLKPEDLKEARWLLGYPEESVGRLMTPDYVAVRAEWSVADALKHIRSAGRDSETINRIFVVDEDSRLIDDLELRRFILAELDTPVADIMDHTFVSVPAFSDREEAVGLIRRYDRIALPVVDSQGVLVGIVTVDDVLDVAEEEATEDFHRVASVDPVRVSLRDAPVHLMYRARIGWLFVLVFMNIFSGAGLAFFEDTIAATMALLFFLPVLIASGGNAGAQSATLMVRALATGDVMAADWVRMLGKEMGVALLLGVSMAIGIATISLFRAPDVLAVVSITMVAVVLVGSIIGMSLPFLLTRMGFDPATASAPLITSLADISGVLIYFTVARWYLGGGVQA
ncbi:MAG TPA: magnesium transporter [Longimicrobiales bacterium]|nr:magnesium transporter [Longimicrobiales bacterium]